MKRILAVSSIIFMLAACAPKLSLPDPTYNFPTPPSVLMKEPERMKPIDTETHGTSNTR